MGISKAEDAGGVVHLLGPAPVYAGRHLHMADYPLHSHSFVEVVVVVGGSAIHECGTRTAWIHKGDVLILKPGITHGYGSCHALEVYNFGVSASLLHHSLSWMVSDTPVARALFSNADPGCEQKQFKGRLPDDQFTSLSEQMRSLEQLCNDNSGKRAEFLAGLLLFLDELVQKVVENQEASTGATHPAVIEGIRLFEDNLGEAWSLEALSGRLHITPSHVVRLFTSQIGLSPLAYLAQRRAETAATLLVDTNYPIARVGRDVGWPDQNYFARRFRLHSGMSPTAYRARFGQRPVA